MFGKSRKSLVIFFNLGVMIIFSKSVKDTFIHAVSDPCADVKCKEPKKCKVDERGNPKCACPDERDCPITVNTVCGSDGKTYLNDCVMKAKACEKDMPIYVIKDGYCGKC